MMSAENAPLALAAMILVLLTVVGIVLIPILDRWLAKEIERYRRAVLQLPVNDNASKENDRA